MEQISQGLALHCYPRALACKRLAAFEGTCGEAKALPGQASDTYKVLPSNSGIPSTQPVFAPDDTETLPYSSIDNAI